MTAVTTPAVSAAELEFFRRVTSLAGLGQVLDAHALSGGADSQVYRVTVDGPQVDSVVVKTCSAARLNTDPQVFARQASVLTTVQSHLSVVPTPIYVDADGSRTGRACLVMSEVTNASSYIPADELPQRCRTLGNVLARVHQVKAPSGLQRWRSHRYPHFGMPALESLSDVVPAGAARRLTRWLERFEDGSASAGSVLSHGDFHPGNVLWHVDGHLAGLVDWDYPTIGPPGFDLAHCRADLVLIAGEAAAQALLDGYEQVCGPVTEMALWDVQRGVAALASFPLWISNLAPVGFELDEPVLRARLTDFIRRRAALLTG